MQFTLAALFVSLAAYSAASVTPILPRICAEVQRYGIFRLNSTTLTPGQSFDITVDFTCAVSFGIVPKYTDYYVELSSGGNPRETPVLLARREPNGATIDSFSIQVPDASYSGAGAEYVMVLYNVYPVTGGAGLYYTVGEVETSVNITVPA